MILVDTDVMIDVLRRHEPALAWLRSLGEQALGISGLVAMELMQGCRNRNEQRRVATLLRPYVLYWPNEVACKQAYDDFASYYLSHGLGILDALIAATAVSSNAVLATFNDKHYRVVSGLRTVQPYGRGG
jgi:predicted nucleic acid-binding protein